MTDTAKSRVPAHPTELDTRDAKGAPGGARQHVRSGTEQGAAARPGGATQNSGGSIAGNSEELGTDPGRGAD